MAKEMCRLCLKEYNLMPIFANSEQTYRYCVVLALTTGLKIEPGDGLPQKICTKCVDLVNMSIKFRNQCHYTEKNLIKNGFERKKQENMANKIKDIKLVNEKNDSFENISTDCYELEGFKIEVELDRLTEDGIEIEEAKSSTIEPIRKNRKREQRQLYLNLVEGDFNPNGPVKCKVCKKSVRRWACFINHAKLHLGFKFICEFCGKSFITSNQLKRHCRSYHGMERELKCKHCSYLALDNAQLVVHERRMHTGDRPYVCDVCAAAYHSRKCLLQHIECHRTVATVQCDQCSALFKSSRHLAKHRYGVHTDKRRERRRARRKDSDKKITKLSDI